MARRDFVKYHLRQALWAAVAELDGDKDLSQRLRAETKLQLMCMSDEELRELAKLTSSPPERSVELVYEGIKQAIEDHRATASEWINDLAKRPMPDKERKTDRILIIEAEPSLGKELASALTEASFTVAVVPDYVEALLKLDEFKPDMAIVDEVLPGGDGMEACSQLRNTFSTPVILLGSDSGDEIWTKAVEAGADFYFRKPFSYRELAARIRAILRRYLFQ